MPSKWSGSEGTDVAKKFTDIRILEGLFMNAFHGDIYMNAFHGDIYECISWGPLDYSHITTFIPSF